MTGTDSNSPRRVLDDPQRRHGHPMGQKKIYPLGRDLAGPAMCALTPEIGVPERTHAYPGGN